MRQSPVLPFIGPFTFLKSPIVDLDYLVDDQADIIFVGVPFDSGASNRPGGRYGPQAIREASMLYTYGTSNKPFAGLYDIDTDQTYLLGQKIIDAGDIEVFPLSLNKTIDNMADHLEKIFRRHGFPVIVGGDHSITYGAISSIKQPTTIIQFDSHCDFMSPDESIDYCAHGSVMRRSSDLPHVEQILHVGIRGLLNSRAGVMESIHRGNIIISAECIMNNGPEIIRKFLDQNKRYYITFDIDVLDPSIAPGTGTPEPGGLSYIQAREMLKSIGLNYDVIGIDLVEVNPLYDPTKITGLYAARLLVDFLCAKFSNS